MSIVSITILLYSVALADLWTSRLKAWFYLKLRFKPFYCQPCMGGWFALIICLIKGLPWLDTIGHMALAIGLAELYDHLFHRARKY